MEDGNRPGTPGPDEIRVTGSLEVIEGLLEDVGDSVEVRELGKTGRKIDEGEDEVVLIVRERGR